MDIHASVTPCNRFLHFSISSFVEHGQPSTHIFTTEAATNCPVCCRAFPITLIVDSGFVTLTCSTREPKWEDSLSEAEERQRRARSVAVESGSQWCTWHSPQRQANAKVNLFPICVCQLSMHHRKALVTGGNFPVPPPPIVVTEQSGLRTCAHPMLASRLKTANPSRCAPSPHELNTIFVPVIAVQASSGTTTPLARNSRRRRRRKLEQKKPPPTYWKPPVGLRGKCMGYALGYPSNWGNTGVPGGGYSRDVMKKGVYA